MLNKFKLWLISTSTMWAILLVKTWKVPLCLTFWQGFEWAPTNVIFCPSNIVAYISLICILLGGWSLWMLNYKLKGSPTSLPVHIKNTTDESKDYVNSLATLTTMFAVLIVNYETYQDLLVLIVMLTIIYVCYTQTNLYYANPIMALLKYKIAKVETNVECKELPSGSIILYKGDLKDRMMPYYVADNVYIVL